MVGLRDIGSLDVPGSDFVELLLFSGDTYGANSIDTKSLRESRGPKILFVHAQEFMSFGGGEVLVDLASEEEGLRRKSMDVVESARNLARSIGGAKVVIHPGGVRDGSVDKRVLRKNLATSLEELGPDLLLLENMPWFYWHKASGRMVANLCVEYHDMVRLSDLVEGLTLDTCHGYLSRPEGDRKFCEEFLTVLGERTLHMHASDARAPDKEGLQIGDGDVDFSFLEGIEVPVLVEIWNGHENNGEGFRLGIERLRSLAKGQTSESRRKVP